MDRLKLRYSPDELILDQYTFGKEFMTEDMIEYVGLYHKYTTGEVYTRPNWDASLSKPLVAYIDTTTTKYKYDALKYNKPVVHVSVYSYQLTPTNQDYAIGYLDRFFCKKRNEASIIEVNKQQYEDWESERVDTVLYDMIQIKWWISGNIDDTYDGITKYGVRTKNKLIVMAAEIKLPGMISYLNNYTQFYADTDVFMPKDINA